MRDCRAQKQSHLGPTMTEFLPRRERSSVSQQLEVGDRGRVPGPTGEQDLARWLYVQCFQNTAFERFPQGEGGHARDSRMDRIRAAGLLDPPWMRSRRRTTGREINLSGFRPRLAARSEGHPARPAAARIPAPGGVCGWIPWRARW